jgi:hypothetical protein
VEELKVEEAVDAEMKTHLYQQLEVMEHDLAKVDPEKRSKVATTLRKLRDVYDAYFTQCDYIPEIAEDFQYPIHVKRAAVILATLETLNEE